MKYKVNGKKFAPCLKYFKSMKIEWKYNKKDESAYEREIKDFVDE